jgi:adenylate kinase
MASKRIIILFGPPGSGKGTQGTLLAEKFGLYYFEASKILEEAWSKNLDEIIEVEGQKYSLREEKEENWEKGKLCSPPFVTVLFKRKIEEIYKQGKGIIFAGTPRTLYEGEKLAPLYKELYGQENIKIILLELSPEQTIFRNSHRKICELVRHPILYSEETKNLRHCPLDGSRLLKRGKLDDPETIKIRIKEYEERTLPLVKFFEQQGLEIKRINGEQSVAEVFGGILKALE